MPFEIVKPGTHFDFIGRWRLCAAISALVLLAAGVALATKGMRFGIDFSGGTQMIVHFEDGESLDEQDIRDALTGAGLPDPDVVRFRDLGGSEFSIKLPGGPDEQGELADTVRGVLDERFGAVRVEGIEFVGPRVGAELRRDGLNALLIACLLILGYVAFRFSARFAPGAVVALVHDVLITAGVFVILGVEFDLRVLAALLAILGYSLNDTIIVYDRIRENMGIRTKRALEDVINRSVNQTLSRTLLTSMTTLLAVGALLIFGGPVIRPFALAMMIGILVGTYSSVFIAAPTVLWLEQRFAGRTVSA